LVAKILKGKSVGGNGVIDAVDGREQKASLHTCELPDEQHQKLCAGYAEDWEAIAVQTGD
jgi:hypothetical protein